MRELGIRRNAPRFEGLLAPKTPRLYTMSQAADPIALMMDKILSYCRSQGIGAVARLGVPDLLGMVADETVGTTEEEILPFLQEKGHPALTMESILD